MQIHFCRVIYTHSNEEFLLEDVLYMIVNPQSAAKRNNIAGCLVLKQSREREKETEEFSDYQYDRHTNYNGIGRELLIIA